MRLTKLFTMMIFGKQDKCRLKQNRKLAKQTFGIKQYINTLNLFIMSKSFLKTILLTIFIAINNFAFAQNDLKAHIEFGKAETAFQDRNYQTALEHITENEKLLGIYSGKVSFLKIQILKELADFRSLDDTYLADLTKEVNKYMNYADKNPSKVPIEKLTTVYDLEQRIKENRADLEQERIAKEKKLAEEKRLKEQAEAKSYADAMSGNVSAIRRFLKDYPNHHGKPNALDLLDTKEEEAYHNAITKDDVWVYENYLDVFYDGKHKTTISNELNKLKERKAYDEVVRANSAEKCETYLGTYRNGENKTEVLKIYEEILYKESQQAMLDKDYKKAELLSEKYINTFPQDSNIKTMQQSYDKAQQKIKKQEIIAKRNDKKYFMLNYATNESAGIEVGKINNSYKLSVYGALNYGFRLPIEEYDIIELESVNDYQGDGSLKAGLVSASFGFNMKITYPLWVYAGGGVKYQVYVDSSSTSYKIIGEDEWQFFPEFGLRTRLGKTISLKAGVQLFKNKPAFVFGIGF